MVHKALYLLSGPLKNKFANPWGRDKNWSTQGYGLLPGKTSMPDAEIPKVCILNKGKLK